MEIDVDKIRIFIKTNYKTQKYFAQIIGVSKETISRLLNQKSCPIKLLNKIACTMDVNFVDLLK